MGETVLPLTTQSIWPAQPNALLAWLRDHEPEVMKRARWVLMCKDYVRYRLTGEIKAELTDMSGTSLMNVGTAQILGGNLYPGGGLDQRRATDKDRSLLANDNGLIRHRRNIRAACRA